MRDTPDIFRQILRKILNKMLLLMYKFVAFVADGLSAYKNQIECVLKPFLKILWSIFNFFHLFYYKNEIMNGYICWILWLYMGFLYFISKWYLFSMIFSCLVNIFIVLSYLITIYILLSVFGTLLTFSWKRAIF